MSGLRLLAVIVSVGSVAIAGAFASRAWFALPPPTGSFAVGTIALRAGTSTVQVWYPAEPGATRAPYGVAAPGLKRWVYRQIVGTHASGGAAFAAVVTRAPVLVYIAGWGGERTDNTALLEDLASHGFVIASLGDVAFDDPPAARLSGPADFTSSAANDATQRLAHAKLAYDVARVGTVIERLAALDRNDPTGRFTGRLDLTRIGALGYSFGGAVAFAAARHDPRVRAVLNMDGWLFDAASGYRGGFPYFVMSDRGALPGADELASANPVVRYTARLTLSDERIQAAALAHGGYELRIAGAQHLNFSDVPLYTLRHRGGVDPHAVSRTVRAYAVAFFDHTLRGARPALLADPRSTGELTFNRWPFDLRGNH